MTSGREEKYSDLGSSLCNRHLGVLAMQKVDRVDAEEL